MEPIAAHAPIWEQVSLPTCQRAVQYDRDEPEECGDPALHRVSFDGSRTWLYLCDEHAAEIDDKEAT